MKLALAFALIAALAPCSVRAGIKARVRILNGLGTNSSFTIDGVNRTTLRPVPGTATAYVTVSPANKVCIKARIGSNPTVQGLGCHDLSSSPFAPHASGNLNTTLSWTLAAYNYMPTFPYSLPMLDDLPPSFEMGMDQCAIRFVNMASSTSEVYAITSQCYQCVKRKIPLTSPVTGGIYQPFPSAHGLDIELRDPTTNVTLTSFWQDTSEHGVYTIAFSPPTRPAGTKPPTVPVNSTVVQLLVEHSGNWEGVHILVATLVLIAMALALKGGDMLYQHLRPLFRDMVTSAARPRGARASDPLVRVSAASYGGLAVAGEGQDASSAAAAAGEGSSGAGSEGSGGKRERVHSLDTFRGICLAVMIFVNYGGGGYWFFNHSVWNGLTFADTVFPLFLWIMGASMVFSFRAFRQRTLDQYIRSGQAHTAGLNATVWLGLKILRRSVTLFLLGMFLNNGYDLDYWRTLGVLQYFGVAYLVCGVVHIATPKHRGGRWVMLWEDREVGSAETEGQGLPLECAGGEEEAEERAPAAAPAASGSLAVELPEVAPYRVEWAVIALCPILYLSLQYGLEVPGCPRGYTGPGGIGDFGNYPKCTGGAHRKVDIDMVGENHIYQYPTSRFVYQSQSFDPEGVLGMLSAITTCFLGCLAGRIFVAHRSAQQRYIRWAACGVACGALALILCGSRKNDGWIPVNKNLWSPSYVLAMSSIGFLALALCYFAVDHRNLWGGAPFRAVGMNSILIYVGHELLQNRFPFGVKTAATHAGMLKSNLLGVCVWLLIAHVLHVKRIYVNV